MRKEIEKKQGKGGVTNKKWGKKGGVRNKKWGKKGGVGGFVVCLFEVW